MIQKIVDLSKDATRFESFIEPGGRVMRLRQPDGTIEEIDVSPPDRRYSVHDLGSFWHLLTIGNGANKARETGPVIFVDGTNPERVRVTGVIEESNRRETVQLILEPSAALVAFNQLSRFNKQKDVVVFLRDALYGCYEAGLLSQLRALDFSRKSNGERTIDHGKESLGYSVEKSVQSKRGEIPEVVVFEVPMFASNDFTEFVTSVPCCVDFDTVNEMVRFAPRGDALALAYQSAVDFVMDSLGDQPEGLLVPVVRGTFDDELVLETEL